MARRKLKELGISLNNPRNGIYLPNQKGIVQSITHPETFTKEYSEIISPLFDDVYTRDEALELLADIKNSLLDGTFFDLYGGVHG